jgi:hypothetical protein
MRAPIGLIVLVCAAAACAETPGALQAQSYGAPAAAAVGSQHGYSDAARRHADCVASYPGYDPRTDTYEVRPGVTRRCPL